MNDATLLTIPASVTGILGAMPSEIDMLLAAMSAVSVHQLLGRQFYQGQLYGHPVVLVQGGIGKVRAAITATTLVNHFAVHRLLFTGVAAALRTGLAMGDVLLANQAIEHDFGTGRPEGFRLGLDFLPGEHEQWITANPALLHLVLAKQAEIEWGEPSPPQVHHGRIATGDIFIASADLRQQVYQRTLADAVEMEGVAVLRVAQDAGIPCLLIRSISDEGDSHDFLQFCHLAARHSAAVVKTILQALG
ncbi:MAG: 5'-methylthioadenosine/adenosylhomocysteine nucleosidase [Cyanobacteriota bacterium]|nr:5'-methylthioadenosine/adenosylhomocysteine nucleosidase [Cyanobacteriota bacterium]